ncbi:hypothetical protein JHK82_057445 [Glycine max]|nr:hypothetical protein JHK82_057445 [Glycine max]
MDVLSLRSSSSLSMSKPFESHGLPLSRSATMDEIKRAYRSMALQYHPDVCHDPSMKEESTRMFVQLNAAYETLSNPRLREQYDSELGLRSEVMSVSSDHERWRSVSVSSEHERWESRFQEQVIELKTRSRRRMGQKGGSSGSRMRAPNMRDRN